MKNIKNMVVYGIIIFLCIAAFVGYITTNKSGKSSTVMNKVESEKNTEAATTVQKAGTQPEKIDADKLKHVEEVMKKAVEAPDPSPVIGIGRGEDYAKVTVEAVDNAGGFKDKIKKGDIVLIKPNICTMAEAGSPFITDYRVVQEIANMAVQYGASKVIVADGTISGNAFSPTFLKLNKYDTVKGVELIDFNDFSKENCYELKPDKSLTGKALLIPKIYMDADVVISVAKLKTHFQPDAVVSLSLKNAIGVPPGKIYGVGSKTGLHNLGLKESIVDLNKIRKPDFAMIEGIVGGEGDGPLRNTPVKSNIIFAGKDLVALDTVATNFMGFNVEEIPHLKLASDEKMGISDVSKIKIVGADLNAIKMDFYSTFKLMRKK